MLTGEWEFIWGWKLDQEMAERQVSPWDFIAILEKHKNAQKYGRVGGGIPADFTWRDRVTHLTYFYYMCLSELIYSEEHKTLWQVLDLHIFSLGADLLTKQNAAWQVWKGTKGEKKGYAKLPESSRWDELIQLWPHLGHFTIVMDEAMGRSRSQSNDVRGLEFELRHVWVLRSPSVLSITGDLSECLSPRLYRWPTSASNYCLR